jgi:hypothetical protein
MDVRMAAISALAIIAIDAKPKIVEYLLGIASEDPCPFVQAHTARSLVEACAWQLCCAEIDKSGSVDSSLRYLSEGINMKKASTPREQILAALGKIRQNFSGNMRLRELLWKCVGYVW